VTSSVTANSAGLLSKGTLVGSAAFTAGTQHLTVTLVLSRTLKDPGAGWRFTHPRQLL